MMVFISILTLIVAKALPVLNTHISSIHFTRITTIIFIFTGSLSLNSLNIESIGKGIGIYSGLFQVSTIGQTLEIFLFIIGGLILIGWPLLTLASPNNGKKVGNSYLIFTDKNSTDYSLIVLFSSLGSSLLISSFDLISVYLSIELQSFGLYVLATLYRDSESSTSAGLKYFLLGGLSSCIILLGTGLVYSYSGTTNFESLYIINSVSDLNQQYILQGISIGLILIFIGFLFKIAAAPLHNWSPDVYDGTPTIVTTWLTIIPKISILVLLLELQVQLGIIGGLKTIIISDNGYIQNLTNLGSINEFITNISLLNLNLIGYPVIKSLLITTSILSLIIGSLLGLSQIRIKRLLAYSTISHIGFILLALCINTEQSIDSFIFYILQYTITNLNIFLILLSISYLKYNKYLGFGISLENTPSLTKKNSLINIINFQIKDISYISQFKGLFFSNPLITISLAISLFSMAGIPPLIGFFSKQFVLYSALQNGYYFISIIAIIVSVISASYYLKIVKVLFTSLNESESDSQSESKPSNTNNIIVTNSQSLKAELEKENTNLENNTILTNTHSYLISTLTFSILLFFIKPSIILNSTQLLSLSLFYI